MLFRKSAPPPVCPEPEHQEPAIQRSICTGEMTGGYWDRRTGRFHALELLRSEEEKRAFCRRAGVEPDKIRVIY